MKLLRASFLSILLAGAVFGIASVPSDASASVSIAVGFDALVKDADAVAVITPVDSKSVWEDHRIITYTKVHVDQGVAGDLKPGADGWVRTLGGVVGGIGQLVDGEPVFVPNKSSLLFLRRGTAAGTFEVSARGQGQFPVIVDDATKIRKVIKSASAGVILPPKTAVSDTTLAATDPAKTRLAAEVIHDRPLDDVSKEIADAWKKAHAAPGK